MKDATITENKKGLHDFEIVEKFQAGIKLTGPEVKSAKAGLINLTGSFVKLIVGKNKQNEAWLTGSTIAKYSKSGYSQNSYDPSRERKLLLTRKEIDSLIGKAGQKTLTIIPISVYTSHRIVKLEIAMVKSKRKFDKREAIKKREFEINKRRLIKE